jgi:hypothetical protein
MCKDCRATASVTQSNQAGDAPVLQLSPSHQLRLPGNEEEREEREKADGDDELEDERNEKDAIHPGRSPNPVSDNGNDYDRLNEHEHKVDRVRIVPFVVMRQPSPGPQ